jgi:hypothetical protein
MKPAPFTGKAAVCAYVLEDGRSALADVWLPSMRKGDVAAGEPAWVGRQGASECVIVGGPSQSADFGAWHVSRTAGYSIVLQGGWEVETGDGQRRRLELGDVFVMLDTHGQGHRSRSLGEGSLVMGVSVDAEAQAFLEERLKEALG